MKKVVIIGGTAAGPKTAARLKRIRPDFDITIIEKNEIISFSSCGMPFLVSGEVDDFQELTETSYGMIRDTEYFEKVKDVKVLTGTIAEKINTNEKIVNCRVLNTNEELLLHYDSLVIATGAKPVTNYIPYPESPRISTFHNPMDAKRFSDKIKKEPPDRVAIIGGGYISCELAEALTALWGFETHIIEIEPQLLPTSYCPEMAGFVRKQLEVNDINIHLSKKVEKIELDENGMPVIYIDGEDSLKVDFAFICTGVKPETELARSIGITIGECGGIIVDKQMRTNLPGIWAVGDCVEIKNLISEFPSLFQLGSLANRQGRVAADSIAGLDSSFKGAVGAASLKVFGLIATSCGLTEKKALSIGYNVAAVYGNWYDRPQYHPESKSIFAKLIYDKNTLNVLGLQLCGQGEVTRYNDIFAEIAARHGTLYDLLDVEHAYTPPHSSPLNPLNSLGAIAVSQEIDGIINFNPNLISNFNGNIIDVRESIEIETAPLSVQAKEISIKDVRLYKFEYVKNSPLLFVCQRGPRSYEAARLFKNEGFSNVSYVGGGVQFANMILDRSE